MATSYVFWIALLAFAPPLLLGQHSLQPGQLADTQNEAPLDVKQKFEIRAFETFGLRGFVGSAVSAAIGQADNSPHEWGQGTLGYGRRFVSGFGGNLSRQVMTGGLESALHEDPRYFLSTDRGFKARAWNVVKQAYLCKKDDGSSTFAYARWISAFGNGQFVNLWQPDSINSPAHGVERGFITIGADTGIDFLREFVPFARSRAVHLKP